MTWLKRSTKRCADAGRDVRMRALALGASAVLAGCGVMPSGGEKGPGAQQPEQKGTVKADQTSRSGVPRTVKLPPPDTPRSWAHAREQAARRMVAASPDVSYTTKAPPVLLAIPVLTIELNADGSVRDIDVMRYPSQARDTVQLAIQAVRRAAPFGNVSKLPRPWKFNETFLFNDQRQFKPMTLDHR